MGDRRFPRTEVRRWLDGLNRLAAAIFRIVQIRGGYSNMWDHYLAPVHPLYARICAPLAL